MGHDAYFHRYHTNLEWTGGTVKDSEALLLNEGIDVDC